MEIKKNTNISKVLLKKLNNKTAKIGIFGLGYVGLPLCLTYSEKGYKVIGFDIDEKIEKLILFYYLVCFRYQLTILYQHFLGCLYF